MADRLPGLCPGLQATGRAGAVAAQRLLDLAWEWIGKDIGTGLASPSPSYRDEKLGDLGRPLASVLTAAAAIGAASTRDTVTDISVNRRARLPRWRCPRCAPPRSCPGTARAATLAFGDLAADMALARPADASECGRTDPGVLHSVTLPCPAGRPLRVVTRRLGR